jgi:MFS family permease
LFGLVGIAPAGVIMALTGEAMRPEQRAFGMGIFFTVYYAIMLVTPPSAGGIFDATGHAGVPIMCDTVLFAGVLAATLAFRHAKSVRPVPIPRQV